MLWGEGEREKERKKWPDFEVLLRLGGLQSFMIEGIMLFTKRFIGKVKVKFYSKQEDYNLNKICHFIAKFSQKLRSGNDNFAEIKTKI